ncbi:MAG: bifunctional adenosylcobinamide kinase/adenosylcobinamide-phosphate guanylyltransferase [Pelagerythrobacter marensis]|nr:MAG: bifunctional adenosylcobinamide kinase/adenosylcobinamide-phosphate guanylyltransferase [Pelagerythrobacter marensis]
MSLVHLILGGARSGKSRHALSICGRMRGPHKFIATAQAYDDEMTERIRQHREERANFWHTIEAPIELARAITSVNGEADALVESIARAKANVVLVSNEVGSGIVPENRLGRDFRDEQGRLNQRLAEISDTVELVVAGLPLRLKG